MIDRMVGVFAACQSSSFFGLPTWYKYLESVDDKGTCQPVLSSIWDFWLVAAAITDMLLRIAAMIAVVFVVWGGVKYIQSQGEPNNTKNALMTIIGALIGLTISVVASAMISFIAGRF